MGACQAPAAIVDAWMIVLLPFERDQTATASPAASTATCGAPAFSPAADRSRGCCQAPPAALPARLDDVVGAVVPAPDRERVSGAVDGELGFGGILAAEGEVDGLLPRSARRPRRRLDDRIGAVGA